jgi:lysophospholipase L1-like esterase
MNDITDGKSVETWMRDILKLRKMIIKKYDISEIIFSGIPPVRKLTQVPHPLLHVLSLKAYIFEKALRDFCKKNEECCFIDIDLPVSSQTMAIDGFHPNEVFYSAWAKRISKSIIK